MEIKKKEFLLYNGHGGRPLQPLLSTPIRLIEVYHMEVMTIKNAQDDQCCQHVAIPTQKDCTYF